MPLLHTDQYRDKLLLRLRETRLEADIVSAYMTVRGIETLLAQISPILKSVRFLARWDARDLVFGASDPEVYELIRKRGFRLYINPTLHAKFVLLDGTSLLLGSANFTSMGLALDICGNWEAGTEFVAGDADKAAIANLFGSSVPMTDALYEEIRKFVDAQTPSTGNECTFPSSIANLLQTDQKGLWVRELPWLISPEELSSGGPAVDHDRRLFEITSDVLNDRAQLAIRFGQSRCCRWLERNLQQHAGQLYFGELSALLHESLLEDPKPYRKDVKALVSNLINWAVSLLPNMFDVDSPHYSQRIRLLLTRRMSEAVSSAQYQEWIHRLTLLRRDEIPGRWGSPTKGAAPHKPLLLLAILDQVDQDELSGLRQLKLTSDLQDRFYLLWRTVMGTIRSTNIALPFYHLSTDGLWTIYAANGSGINSEYARSLRYLEEIGAVAQLDPEFSRLLGDKDFRVKAKTVLLQTYFDNDSAEQLKNVLCQS